MFLAVGQFQQKCDSTSTILYDSSSSSHRHPPPPPKFVQMIRTKTEHTISSHFDSYKNIIHLQILGLNMKQNWWKRPHKSVWHCCTNASDGQFQGIPVVSIVRHLRAARALKMTIIKLLYMIMLSRLYVRACTNYHHNVKKLFFGN